MNGKPMRFGVVGAGGIAQMMHLPTLAERPDLFEIGALADVSAETLEQVSRRYHVKVTATDFRQVLANKELDAVLLAASGSHRDQVIAALEAGKHVFVEKPLGFSPKEAEEVAQAARKSQRTLMIGYHKRFDPAYRRAREAVRAMGDLRFVNVQVLHPDDGAYRFHHAIYPNPDRSRTLPPEAVSNQGTVAQVTSGPMAVHVDDTVGKDAPVERRVGAFLLFQSLIHDVNAVRGILGEPEEVVSASVWQGGFAQTSLTRFAKEVRVNMSWVSLPGVRNYEETLLFVGPQQRVKLTFPSPYLRHAPTPLTIERMDGEDLVVEHRTVSYEEAFRLELHHFRDCVLSGARPETHVDDALGDTRWIHAIAQAYIGKAQSVRR